MKTQNSHPCIMGSYHYVGWDLSVYIGVMVSILTLWAGGPGIDTRFGTFNGNHDLNGLNHIYVTRWTKLALSVVLFTA